MFYRLINNRVLESALIQFGRFYQTILSGNFLMLSKTQIKHLRKLAHGLNPVIMLGQNGFTEAVLNELNIALEHHELVKIKLSGGDRDQRNQQIDDICKQSHSEQVQSIGKTVTIYRRNKDNQVIEFPAK